MAIHAHNLGSIVYRFASIEFEVLHCGIYQQIAMDGLHRENRTPPRELGKNV